MAWVEVESVVVKQKRKKISKKTTRRLRCVDCCDMEESTGNVKVKIVRGVNLAVRDSGTSDPYVILKYDKHVCIIFLGRNYILNSKIMEICTH